MNHIITAASTEPLNGFKQIDCCIVLTTPGIGVALSASGSRVSSYISKRLSIPPADATTWLLSDIFHRSERCQQPIILILPPSIDLFSSSSLAAYLSKHWLLQQTDLEYAGGPQIQSAAELKQGTLLCSETKKYYTWTPISSPSNKN
jgi:hypothetical protein